MREPVLPKPGPDFTGEVPPTDGSQSLERDQHLNSTGSIFRGSVDSCSQQCYAEA